MDKSEKLTACKCCKHLVEIGYGRCDVSPVLKKFDPIEGEIRLDWITTPDLEKLNIDGHCSQ